MDKKTYKRYLRTQHWQQIRAKVLQRANGRCERCGYEPWRPGTLQVHHLSYDRLGAESLEDLVAICPRCHMKIHAVDAKSKRNPENVQKHSKE